MDDAASQPSEAAAEQRPAPPAKKPLEQFLAEFEERLRLNPDAPATGALVALDDRAAGSRHSAVESEPDRPPRLPRPRPWRTPPAAPALDPPPPEAPVEAMAAPPRAETAEPRGAEAPADGEAKPEPERNASHKHHHRRRRRHR